jgi:flagellar hook-length control protein FliK
MPSTVAPATTAAGASIIGASQNFSDMATRSRAGARESSTQRVSSGDVSRIARNGAQPDMTLARSEPVALSGSPAFLATDLAASTTLSAAQMPDSAVPSASMNQASVSGSAAQAAPASTEGQRMADRWMHVDDLGKQFGSVIQGALLNRTVAGQTSLRIMLNPENMGSIEAEIIDNNNTVTVNLIAQSDEVVRMLRENSQALRDSLTQNGSFELNILKERSESDAQQARDSSGSGHGRSRSQSDNLSGAGNDVAPGSVKSKENGALDTYV